MTGQLSKNFHEVGIGPLSKILAVKLLTTRNKILALQSKSPVLQLTTPCMCFKINASTTHFNSTHSNVVGIWYSFFYLLLTIGVRILTNQGHTPSGPHPFRATPYIGETTHPHCIGGFTLPHWSCWGHVP